MKEDGEEGYGQRNHCRYDKDPTIALNPVPELLQVFTCQIDGNRYADQDGDAYENEVFTNSTSRFRADRAAENLADGDVTGLDTGVIGAMGDIGCYSLDMVLNAIGYPKPLTVTGYTSNFFGKNPEYFKAEGKPAEYADVFGVEDFAAGFIRLEGDIMLDFRIAWAMHLDTPGDTIIMGTNGSLRIPSTECWNGSIGGPMKIYHEVAGSPVETEIPMLPGGDNFYNKVRSFLDAIKEGGTAPVPSSQILYNQAIIDGIVKSAKLGHEIEIDIPEV